MKKKELVTIEQYTKYANTDLDLKSRKPLDRLCRELEESCCVLHYEPSDDGDWHACIESNNCRAEKDRSSGEDILEMLAAITKLPPTATSELAECHLREFNIGFHCWDTWAYTYKLPSSVVQAVADAGFSLAVTLYPMRYPDGRPRG